MYVDRGRQDQAGRQCYRLTEVQYAQTNIQPSTYVILIHNPTDNQ